MEKYTQQAEFKNLYSLSKWGREWCKTLKWKSGIGTLSSKYEYDSRPSMNKYLGKKKCQSWAKAKLSVVLCSYECSCGCLLFSSKDCIKHEEGNYYLSTTLIFPKLPRLDIRLPEISVFLDFIPVSSSRCPFLFYIQIPAKTPWVPYK